jgi:hypothetical protein
MARTVSPRVSSRLILQAGQRLTGSPFTEALERAGRRLLVRLYLRAYRSRRPFEVAAMELWSPIVALVRLAADVPEEREPLLAIARRGLRGGPHGPGGAWSGDCRREVEGDP